MLIQLALAASVLTLGSPITVPIETATGHAATGTVADYYGAPIDLGRDWGTAQACATDGQRTRCFNTEAEMDFYLGSSVATHGDMSLSAGCSTGTRLYAGASGSGCSARSGRTA